MKKFLTAKRENRHGTSSHTRIREYITKILFRLLQVQHICISRRGAAGQPAVGGWHRSVKPAAPAEGVDNSSWAGGYRNCYRNDTQLVSHSPQSGKVVAVLSSQHKVSVVDRNTGKPKSVPYYNNKKGGVNVTNPMMEDTQLRGVVRHWPTRVLMFTLAAACLNGHFIYAARFPESKN